MNNNEVIVKSSLQLFLADKNSLKPVAFGSGCILVYKNEHYLLSVSHVTDLKGLTTFIETNHPPKNGTTPIKPVGGLVTYNLLTFPSTPTPEEVLKGLEAGGKRLDITFAKLSDRIDFLQNETEVEGGIKIPSGQKVFIQDTQIAVPSKNERYSFFGKIKHHYKDVYLVSTPTLKSNLKFHRTQGDYHIFLAPKIIKDSNDYEGCSGAPIIDSKGNIVALACMVGVPSQMVYGFSIQECFKLLKMTIDIGRL